MHFFAQAPEASLLPESCTLSWYKTSPFNPVINPNKTVKAASKWWQKVTLQWLPNHMKGKEETKTKSHSAFIWLVNALPHSVSYVKIPLQIWNDFSKSALFSHSSPALYTA